MNFTEYEIETNTQPYFEDIFPITTGRDILMGAKKIIKEKGWCKKSLKRAKYPPNRMRSWQENPIVGYCILGAIEESAKNQLDIAFVKSHESVLEAINAFERSNSINSALTISSWDSNGIPQWNDKWYRSKKSVLKAFNRFIQDLTQSSIWAYK